MHILYFHQYFSTPEGSAGTRSYEMARALLRAGHRVTMVCSTHQSGTSGLDGPFARGVRRGTVDGIDVVEFDLSYSNHQGLVARTLAFLRFALRSLFIALRSDHDLVFATSTPLTAGIPGIAARWLRRSPFVFEVRDLWPELPRAMGVVTNRFVLAAMSALEWASYRSADRCIALAPGIRDGIARRGIPHDRIALVPNGCDLDLFGSARPWRPDGVAQSDLLAVFAGAHGVANGLDSLLDIAECLRRMGRGDIRIALIGDGKCKPRLVADAGRRGLDNLLFLPPQPKLRLAGLLRGADIGLQVLADVPAFYEGTSPNKFFDYLASGLPVLNTYPGWLARIIAEDGLGFAVPPRDPQAAAEALVRAADDREALAAMGGRARRVAESRFSRDRLSLQWVDWVIGAARR